MTSPRSTEGGVGPGRPGAGDPGAGDPATAGPAPERLQKVLARAGVASRRACEELIRAGRVRVNGEVVSSLGEKVVPGVDRLEVDGEMVALPVRVVYLALNKPAGYITTAKDQRGRSTVMELLPRDVPGLFPVGRLDLDSEGLLLAMTDGELGHRLLHPRFHVEKTYEVVADGAIGDAAVQRLRSGVSLDDGLTAPAVVEVLERSPGSTRLAISIREGRKRQVRRMVSAVGSRVSSLVRVRFGPVSLGSLAPGEWRELTAAEVASLKGAAEE